MAIITQYHNSFHLISQLSKNERLFLDYLFEIMDKENLVTNDYRTKKNYNKFLLTFDLNPIALSSINKTFSALAKSKLAIPISRGVYQINPLYFFKSKKIKTIN
jgi:aromatic ring-opening dioxygenase LigB subunit